MQQAVKQTVMKGFRTGSSPPAVEHVNPTESGTGGAMKDRFRREGADSEGKGFDWWKLWTSRVK
jgi:hypothetical protein